MKRTIIDAIFLLVILALGCLSCSRGISRIQTHAIAQSNPTSCTFPFDLESVRAHAIEAFSIDHQIKNPVFARPSTTTTMESFLSVECSTNAIFSESLFHNPVNSNDVYLHSFGGPFTLSSVYRGRKGPLPYLASFHLHLSPAGSNTLVTISASDTKVINGEKFGFGSCGPGYAWNSEPVKPTTVEEYIILRYLGRYLGLTNMPPVVLPE
jgi:hypothetical protein